MTQLHSSTSNFDHEIAPPSGPTLEALPRPTAAGVVAAITVAACGALLWFIAGGAYGAPPLRVHENVLKWAHRYNATNAPAPAEVLLLGDSLMEMGVIEDLLADELGPPRPRILNLGLAGGRAWDVEHLAERLDPPATTGPRVAVIQVDRAWFDDRQAPLTRYARLKISDLDPAGDRPGFAARAWGAIAAAFPERRESRLWLWQFRYGPLARWKPKLVPVPPPAQPELLWDLDPAAQSRAIARLDQIARGSFREGRFADHSLHALRLAVDQLHKKSYRVVLLLTPWKKDVLDKMKSQPNAAAMEQQFRSQVLDPKSTGADAVIIFDDSAALGVDDSVFIDYGHMNRQGATAQTRKLAQALLDKGFFPPRSPR